MMIGRKSPGPSLSTIAGSSLVTIVALAIAVASPNLAHADKPTALSLAEFSGLVKKGLPADAVIRARVLDAEADVSQARALPPLGISLERQEVFVDGEGVVLQNSAALEWSIDVSGRRGLRIDAAGASLRAARLGGERAHELNALGATAIYLQAARARLRLESLRKSREPLAKLTGALKRRAAEGDVSGADVARFELALSEHDDRVAEAEADTIVAEKRLAALLGRSGRVTASDDLALPKQPSGSSLNRSDLRAASVEQEGGRALIRAASRWWVPKLELSAGYLSTDFGPGSGPGANVARGYLATLSLSLPIFSRGEAERKRGEARMARARATKAVIERQANADIEAARTLLTSRIERAKAHEGKRLVLASELVKKTESAYGGGEATALELRDGYEKATAARLRAVELRFEARMAELELRRARGSDQGGDAR